MIRTLTVPNYVLLRINGARYKQNIKYKSFRKGDLVLDLKDLSYGTVDMIFNSDGGNVEPKYAIKDGFVTEVGVTKDRLIKLEPATRWDVIKAKIRCTIIRWLTD